MTQLKKRHGNQAEIARKLCDRDIGASLREISDKIKRPLNIASVYVVNMVKTGEATKAGVHGKYRYFLNPDMAAKHDLEAKEALRIQMEESAKRRRERDAAAERQRRARIRAEKGMAPCQPKPKKVDLKPRYSGILLTNKLQDIEHKREHKKATVTWPDNVKIIKRETPVDYRFHFEPPPGWKGEFTREWEQRRAA